MVGLFKALLPPLLFATFAAAQNQNLFSISVPSSTNWWGKHPIIISAIRCWGFQFSYSRFVPIFSSFDYSWEI